jgi:hypothetical protein
MRSAASPILQRTSFLKSPALGPGTRDLFYLSYPSIACIFEHCREPLLHLLTVSFPTVYLWSKAYRAVEAARTSNISASSGL